MREQLEQYVKLLFAGTADAEEIQQEILQNTLDRYDDLIEQGKSPEAAYRLAISGIGDINEILGSAASQAQPEEPEAQDTDYRGRPLAPKRKLMQAIAIALYICSVIPVILFSALELELLGVCLMFVIIAIATVLIILSSSGEKKSNNSEKKEKDPAKSVWDTVVVVVYLVLSFATQAWFITWLIFPISANVQKLIREIQLKESGKLLRRILPLIILILLLLALLLSGIGMDLFSMDGSTVEGEVHLDASQIHKLDIDWIGGNVTIRTADVDTITFHETSDKEIRRKMTYEIDQDTLHLDSGRQTLWSKDDDKELIITVPEDWVCQDMSIDAIGSEISVTDLQVNALELDGIHYTFQMHGSAETVDIDGIDLAVKLHCANRITKIDMDGIHCTLDLVLPQNCGFQLDQTGPNCSLQTALPTASQNSDFTYGDMCCKINVTGIQCKTTIAESAECAHQWDAGYPVVFPGSGEQQTVYTCLLCKQTRSEE